MSYTPHEWVSGEYASSVHLNNMEDGISRYANNSRFIYIFKKSESILFEWYEDPTLGLSIRFYGASVDYLVGDAHSTGSGVTIAGATFQWINGGYLVVDVVDNVPTLASTSTLDDVFITNNRYILGHMHYVTGDPAVFINAYGTFVNSGGA